MPPDDRRNRLRRLDDILEALEQMNLRDVGELPDFLAERLVEIGIEQPHRYTAPALIEKVWSLQQPFLIAIPAERRRRRRRASDAQQLFARQG